MNYRQGLTRSKSYVTAKPNMNLQLYQNKPQKEKFAGKSGD